jgi:RNA polymerase sigma-70 factor, ECF subfamily
MGMHWNLGIGGSVPAGASAGGSIAAVGFSFSVGASGVGAGTGGARRIGAGAQPERVSEAGGCCVGVSMSTSPAAFAGWMELPVASVAMKKPMADRTADRAECGPVATAVAGAEVTIAALVDEHTGTLYRVAYSVLRNAADAEDAVQETYLRVLRHRDELGEIRDHRVWLVRIVWNVVLDRKRRAKTRPETDDIADLARMLPAEGLSAEERVASAQHHERVLRAVEELPEKERQVLMLSAFEELSSVEIARILGATESTVRSRLFRARNLMAGLLGHARSVR